MNVKNYLFILHQTKEIVYPSSHMRLTVRIKPNAKESRVISKTAVEWLVAVHAPPVEGKANEELISILAEELDVPKSLIRIIRGTTAKKKIVELG